MFGFSKSAKVTDEEQKNLITSLRGRLSDGSQPVEEQLRAGGEVGLQGLDDVSLGRWLAAENWDIGKAEKRLRPHAVWRKSEFPDGRVSESEIVQELETKKVYLQGLDKKGRQVIVLKVNRHSRSLRDLKQCMRFLCYSLDKAISLADRERNPGGAICGIFDLQGLTMDSIDYHALKGVMEMLQEHYPERLGTLWMYESPAIFWALWKAVSPFVDPVTKKKVVFISGSSAITDLQTEIDLEVLPKEIGGSAELVLIQDVPFSGSVQSADANGAAVKTQSAETNGSKSAQQEVAENGVLWENFCMLCHA